jgi:hypothetical protein
MDAINLAAVGMSRVYLNIGIEMYPSSSQRTPGSSLFIDTYRGWVPALAATTIRRTTHIDVGIAAGAMFSTTSMCAHP